MVNSVVLGATLYNEESSRLSLKEQQEANITVDLHFYFNYDGENYDLSDATCGYWDIHLHSWSEDGCELISSDNYTSYCQCKHLTNFGVLLDINGNLSEHVS